MNTPASIQLDLNEEDHKLIQLLAEERGLDSPEAVLKMLLHDAASIYDRIWEQKFADSQDLLSAMAAEVHEEYIAGLTEEFDPDNDPDAP